jgi:hypothetical protein
MDSQSIKNIYKILNEVDIPKINKNNIIKMLKEYNIITLQLLLKDNKLEFNMQKQLKISEIYDEVKKIKNNQSSEKKNYENQQKIKNDKLHYEYENQQKLKKIYLKQKSPYLSRTPFPVGIKYIANNKRTVDTLMNCNDILPLKKAYKQLILNCFRCYKEIGIGNKYCDFCFKKGGVCYVCNVNTTVAFRSKCESCYGSNHLNKEVCKNCNMGWVFNENAKCFRCIKNLHPRFPLKCSSCNEYRNNGNANGCCTICYFKNKKSL